MKRTIAMVGLCAAMMMTLGCPLLTGALVPNGDMDRDGDIDNGGVNDVDNDSQGGGENENVNDSEGVNDNDNQSPNENENLNDSENINDNDNPPATVSVTAMGTWTLGVGDLDAIRGGLVYFNLHTADNPAGEIRAQVTAGADDNSFVATFSGDQEVPAVTTDATGTGTLTLNADGSEATFDLTATGLSGTVTAAHFHMAAAGEAGDVIFDIGGTIVEG